MIIESISVTIVYLHHCLMGLGIVRHAVSAVAHTVEAIAARAMNKAMIGLMV
jgi:hypothetical protein